MEKRSSIVGRVLADALSSLVVLAAVAAIGAFLTGRAATRALDVPQGQGPQASAEYTTVHAQDFGDWSYSASRSNIEPLHATVNYKHDTVADILAYAEANKALMPTLEGVGGRIDVAVTFVYPVDSDWYRKFAKDNGFQARDTQIRVCAPGVSGAATMNISGTADDPLPQEKVDSIGMGFFSNSVRGIFGAYGTVDARNLGKVTAEPKVFLVDVTPAWVRLDLAQAGVTEQMRQPVQVSLPYGWMERLGLENFTEMPIPTPPLPESTAGPTVEPATPEP